MKPRIDLRVLHFANAPGLPKESPQAKPATSRTVLAFVSAAITSVAMLVLSFAAAPASAQQDWPPDQPNNYGQPDSAPPQPNAPQYGYGQPQYSQQPAYPTQPYYQAPTTPYQAQPVPYQQPEQAYGQQLAQMQAISPDQLTQLVAPIALYPDGLIAQILAASTYPAQIASADRWLRSMGNAPPDQIAAGANAQTNWDPSVKALTAFPQVLDLLNGNLQWTTALGNAYYNQPQDVLQTIQVLRQRAEQAGNLQSTPQEQVTDNQGYIDIAPANPQVVCVPAYNPWDVYGQPVSPYPGFSLFGAIGSFFGSALVHYGPGVAMSAFMTTPWGWLGWGLDWLAHAVLFNHSSYFTRSTTVADWGFPHGGPRAYPGNPLNRGGYRYGGSRDGYRPYNPPAQAYNRGWGGEASRPIQNYGDARTAEGFNRGFAQRNEMPARSAPPSQLAYNHYPQQFQNRPQQITPRTQPERLGAYGSGFYNQPREGSYGRSGMAYANPAPAYRAPENTYHGNFDGRGYSSGNGYGAYGGSASKDYSGGFHSFGNHSSDAYGGKASKAYSYNGGHSGWGGGGSFKAPKAPKEHFGGGGHSGSHEHSSRHH